MKHLLSATLIGSAMVLPLALAAPAEAVRLEAPDRSVAKRAITYAEPASGVRAQVELNNGSVWRLRPCKLEDSNHCYWDASARGNGRGRDFIALGGKAIYVKRGSQHRVNWS